jgi:hypothetical protein
LIAGGEQATIYFDQLLIIGPKLWAKIKSLPEFSNIQKGEVTFKVPVLEKNGSWKKKQDMQGKALQELPEFIKLLQYLEKIYTLSKAVIENMNVQDKFIYWQYFAKIEEGTQTAVINQTRVMIRFTEGKLFFIELAAE